jgi:hypothetical protein
MVNVNSMKLSVTCLTKQLDWQVTKEQRQFVIRFLWSEGTKTSETYGRMTVQYGNNCRSQRKVNEWVERFKGRRMNDSNDKCCGWHRLYVLRFRNRLISMSGTTEESALIKLHLEWQKVQEWLKVQPKIFYSDGMSRRVYVWTENSEEQLVY